MDRSLGTLAADTIRGLGAAIAAQRKVFALTAAAVFALDIALPPLVLSVFRKPADFFMFNPWLSKLPGYLASGPGTLAERLDKAWTLALFWFSSDNPFGVEWGFAVTVADLARFLAMSLLIGAYFALWIERRARLASRGWGSRAAGHGGALGAVTGACGIATGGCTVMGCGAPVIPVAGLAFTGLTSGTLKWMAGVSTAATAAVMLGMVAAVLYMGCRIARGDRARSPSPEASSL